MLKGRSITEKFKAIWKEDCRRRTRYYRGSSRGHDHRLTLKLNPGYQRVLSLPVLGMYAHCFHIWNHSRDPILREIETKLYMQLNSVKATIRACQILVTRCRDLLVLLLPSQAFHNFSCLLKLPTINLEQANSFFGLPFPSLYRD